jgi:hypothetical protein
MVTISPSKTRSRDGSPRRPMMSLNAIRCVRANPAIVFHESKILKTERPASLPGARPNGRLT